MAKQKAILNLQSRIVGGLTNVNPFLLPSCGDQIKRGKSNTKRRRQRSANKISPRTFNHCQCNSRRSQQITRHHAQRRVREPCPGKNQRQWKHGCTKFREEPGTAFACTKEIQQQQWNPKPAGQFSEGRALVGCEQRVPRKKSPTAGQGRRRIAHELASKCARSQARTCQQ